MSSNLKDNYGNPRSLYFEKLSRMTDEELRSECNKKIYLSAYANNNPSSDFHWHATACYNECMTRDKVSIYTEELENLFS